MTDERAIRERHSGWHQCSHTRDGIEHSADCDPAVLLAILDVERKRAVALAEALETVKAADGGEYWLPQSIADVIGAALARPPRGRDHD